MYNKNQIAELEARIAAAIKEDGTDESERVTAMVADIASPNTGLIYKPGSKGSPGHLDIAEGWAVADDGSIVKLEDAAGPGTGMVYRDGKLIKAD